MYKPDSFVVHANDWLKLIFDTLKEVLEIGLAIATEGEELKGAIQGIFDMTEDIIKAKEEKEGVLLSNLSDQAKKNFATSCDAIGRTPDEVRRIAAKMGLPSNFGILAGSAYTNAIHNATGVISGNGFKVRSGISGHNYTHYATACFISNGRLYYYWGENDTSGYWEAD